MKVNVLILVVLSLSTATSSKNTIETNYSCVIQGDYEELLSCPAWFKPGKDNGSCECGINIQDKDIHCHSNNQTKVSMQYCLTFDPANNTVFGGMCPFSASYFMHDRVTGFSVKRTIYNVSQLLDQILCTHFNKTGLLCSKCQEGLGPPVLSYRWKCIECLRYGWLVYILAAFGPTIILCIVIIICRIDASKPTLNLMIMICQLTINFFYEFPAFFQSLEKLGPFISFGLSFYGLFNLDFFRGVLPSFCVSSKMNTLQAIALDYVVALYPLVLTAVLYYCIEFHDKGYRVLVYLWKPFHPCAVRFRRILDVKGSVINVFSTFVLLSYCKILFISAGLLGPMYLYNGCGNKTMVVKNEPSIIFLSKSHLPYALPAITLLVIFVFVPLVYILFYQNKLFQKCLLSCKLDITLFSEMAKVFHRHYKNGINGSPDCRWYAGVYLVFRILYIAFSYFYLAADYSNFPIILLTGVTTVLCAFLQPYRRKIFNVFDVLFLGLHVVCILYYGYVFLMSYHSSVVPIIVLGTLPLVYFICYILIKIIVRLKSMHCFRALFEAIKSKIFKTDQHELEDGTPHRFEHPSEYEPLLPTSDIADDGSIKSNLASATY